VPLLRLATRSSPLALWQAEFVARALAAVCQTELVLLESHGDRDTQSTLASMGGFGVFAKTIQDAVLNHRADVAVHSLKDLPTLPRPGLALVAVPPRGPEADVFVSAKVANFDALPQGAHLATSSIRRRAMILHERPDLSISDLRGNIATRLRKLEEQQWDGIILAEAGLHRLGLDQHIRARMPSSWCLPAVGQGAIGLEARSEDTTTRRLLEGLNHEPTWARVLAERAMLATLGGGCLVPIGVRSQIHGTQIELHAVVLSADGQRRIVVTHRGLRGTPLAVGQECAAKLIDEGAAELLDGCRNNAPPAWLPD